MSTSPSPAGPVTIRPLTPEDTGALGRLLMRGGGYTERVEGRPPRPGDAAAILASQPPANPAAPSDAPAPRVVVLGAVMSDAAMSDAVEPGPVVPGAAEGRPDSVRAAREGELVGVLQMVLGWPNPSTAHIGLVLVDEDHRGSGIGGLLHEHARRLARADPQATTLRLAIVDANASAAVPFWHRLGYAPTGEQHAHPGDQAQGDQAQSIARIWTRPLREERRPRAGLHHLELWTADLAATAPGWHHLLLTLGWACERIDGWDSGRIWRHGDGAYLVLEQSPDGLPLPPEGPAAGRLRPGMNHVALSISDRAALDRLRATAPAHGWRELFADRYPHAGGDGSAAWYAQNAEGIEVEVVALEA